MHLRDLVAIIAVLEFNQWFTKLSTKDYKLVSRHFLEMLSLFVRINWLQMCSYFWFCQHWAVSQNTQKYCIPADFISGAAASHKYRHDCVCDYTSHIHFALHECVWTDFSHHCFLHLSLLSSSCQLRICPMFLCDNTANPIKTRGLSSPQLSVS